MLGHGTGKYQCYCEKYGTIDSLDNKTDMCYDFIYMSYYGKLLGNVASVLVVVFNIASRKTVISMIEKIGLPTMSRFTAGVVYVLYISSFLNTGVITILTSADLRKAPFPLNYIPLHG